jgi:hypothetical protein
MGDRERHSIPPLSPTLQLPPIQRRVHPYLPIMLVAPLLSFCPCSPYATQSLMARAAFLIEDHYDPRGSIFAFVRVCDAVANQGEGAGLVLDAISSARDRFIQRERWIFMVASGEDGHQQHG